MAEEDEDRLARIIEAAKEAERMRWKSAMCDLRQGAPEFWRPSICCTIPI